MSVGVLLLSFGCAGMPPESVAPSMPVQEPRPIIPGPEPTDSIKEPAPRTIASLRLTEQAQALIESKRPDEAIRILEKSLNMDPHNGLNYYFLAEAWIIKGNKIQAIEFNRLAGIYLNEVAAWMDKVQRQKEHIKNIYEK
jgi:tetratricopeptide (TPR) repeat protein